ncbi:MAG: thiol protease/hemagglutinin PrtT [Bacteroidales bacterium]|nr:thiol protease/hemagglutinin PrtT [Bacteroidales bacterium]
MKLLNILLAIMTILLISLIPLVGLSQYVDKTTAKKVAISKSKQLNKSDNYLIISPGKEFTDENHEKLFYVFNLNPTGYVVVSAHTNLPPVIAYSYSNNFDSPWAEENILLKMLKSDIKIRLEHIDKIPYELIKKRNREWPKYITGDNLKSSVTFEQWPPEGTTSTGGWLETNWTQDPPYNNFCPMDPVTGNRSYAGCPAVAMAMIVNYYQTINETTFTDNDDYYHSYDGRYYWIDDDFEEQDFPSFPTLNSHLDTITNCYETQTSLKANEKAALTFACGVAAHQVYTSEGSGTFGVNQAFDAYMKFNFTEAVLAYTPDTSIYSQLSQNMMDARPVHFAVVNPSWTVGHNVVMDGYNTDNYYNLNFGWGGSYNGWYLIPEEIPYELTVIEGAIYNIGYPPLVTIDNETMASETKSVFSISPNPVKSQTEIKYSVEVTGNISIEVYDITGKLIQILIKKLMEPGIYKLVWNPNDIEKGIYIFRIKSENSCLSEKVIIQ